MKKVMIFRQLLAVMALLTLCAGSVFAQNPQHHTDTLYFQEFGCDSVLLSANNSVYYHDTVVEIPVSVADQGVIYVAELKVYRISVGQSYAVRDTVAAKVCRDNLPYAFRKNFYTETGEYWINSSSVAGCDSALTLLQLEVLDGLHEVVDLALCYNQPSVLYDGITFSVPGEYNLPLGPDSNGCPMVRTYRVTRYPMQTDTTRATVCQNQIPYSFHGQQFDTSGTFTIPYTDERGCTAAHVLQLTVNPSESLRITETVTVCSVDLPYIYHGIPISTAGTHYVTLKNQYGCDSVLLTLVLSVTGALVNEETLTLCAEDFPYSYDSVHVFTAPGTYTIDNEPDSVCFQYTVLTLNQYPSERDTVVVCTPDSSYTFHDSTFTASTFHTFIDTNSTGCLDYHSLLLTLNHQVAYDTTAMTVCASELPVSYYGQTCSVPGYYTHVLKNRQGCDSASVTLNLLVIPNPTITNYVTVTRNGIPYAYHGNSYSESGVYTVRVPVDPSSTTQCDTFYTLNLTVLPIYLVNMDTTVCANEPVEFLGDTLTTAGEHRFTYHFSGYDSIVTLTVNHLPTYRDEVIPVLADEYDLPYVFNGVSYTTPGYHEQVLQTVSGCDSVVSILLTINPAVVNNDTILREACSNDLPLTVFDSLLTQAGTYRYITRAVSGLCDSVFYVRLEVKDSPTLLIADTAYMCAGSAVTLTAQSTGSSYSWSNGGTQSSVTVTLPGAYSVTVSGANGCTAVDTVQVIDAPLPNAWISGSNNVCEGNSLLLRAMGGASYVWGDGSTSDSLRIAPSESTTYYVTVTNVYGCSQTKSTTVTVNPLPELTLAGSTSICEGESTTIIVSGGIGYRWSNNWFADRITVSAGGIYTVTASDMNGCQNTASVTVTVHPLPVMRINGRTTICQGGSTTLTASGATSYEWNSGELSQSITASYVGSYTVTGRDQHGCSASKSVTVTQSPVTASITGNRSFCHGESTTLTATGDAGNTYRWFDGSTSASINITTPGQYTLTVTNVNGCSNTLSANVNEYSITAPTISGTLTICQNQTTTLRASGGSSYVWDNGSTQPMITVNATGTYSVTATNFYGCTATTSATVLVNPIPTVNVLGNLEVCRGENVTLTAISSAGTYNWSSGQNTASISVTPAINTTYTVLVTDENGCVNTASTQVTVKSLPMLYVTGPSSVCQGDTATMEATGGVAYQWSTGQYTPSIAITTAASYTVTATGANGCTAVATKTLTVNPRPVATVTETESLCAGGQVQLSTDAPVGCTYTWSTGSHQSRITVSEAGDYTVTITNANQCSRVYHAIVTVYNPPQVNIIGNNSICLGQNTTFTATGEGQLQYSWSNGDHNVTTTVSEAGQYTVTATNEYGCTATASRGLVVHELPSPQISGSLTVCKGSSTTLTATGGIAYYWNTGATGGNLTVSPTSTQSYSVTASNAYGCMSSQAVTVSVNALPEVTFSGNLNVCAGSVTTVTAFGASTYSWSTGSQTNNIVVGSTGYYFVTATNSQGCAKKDSVYVRFNPKPQVQILSDNHICAGTVATLTATGAGSYLWNTGETAVQIAVSPETTTTYSVVGTDSNGCTNTVYKVVNVEALPDVQILGGRTICMGQSTVLTATGGASYQWSTGSTSQSIAVYPNLSANYTVTAYNAFGCSSVTTATVTVNVLPSVVFSGSTAICDGQSTTLTVSGGNSYVWSTGVTGNAITVSSPGYYAVTATNSMNCTRTDSVAVVVRENPTVAIAGPGLVCAGSPAVLTASGASTYLWQTGETGDAITAMPDGSTTYTVVGYDSNGCSATFTKMVNVEALPDVHISGNLAICHGQSTILTASNADTYLWSTGASDSSITVSAYGAYTVTATSANGCQAAASVTVVDNPVPVFTLNGLGEICENTTAELSVSGDNDYLWSTGSEETHITISAGGVYSVTATNGYGCTQAASVVVNQLPAPMLTIVGATSLCQGDSTMLVAASDAPHFLWSTGDTTQTVMVTPENTTYTLTATAANGCTTVREHTVQTLPTYNYVVEGNICEHQSFSQYGFDIPVMDTAGTYTFTRELQTVAGCDSVINLLLTVNPMPRLDTINGNPNITQHGNAFFSVNNPEFVNNFEWRVSNTHWTLMNGNTNNVILDAPVNGSGVLTARGINNCGFTEISLNLYCNVGIEEHTEQAMVTLYPNPVHQSLFINWENAAGVRKVMLYNEVGRLVWQTESEDTHVEVDCSRFANGHYTVQFYDEKGRRVDSRKIIVKNK